MRFAGDQFPYLVIWLPSVFNRGEVDAMTMYPRICRSTVSAATNRTCHGLVLVLASRVPEKVRLEGEGNGMENYPGRAEGGN